MGLRRSVCYDLSLLFCGFNYRLNKIGRHYSHSVCILSSLLFQFVSKILFVFFCYFVFHTEFISYIYTFQKKWKNSFNNSASPQNDGPGINYIYVTGSCSGKKFNFYEDYCTVFKNCAAFQTRSFPIDKNYICFRLYLGNINLFLNRARIYGVGCWNCIHFFRSFFRWNGWFFHHFSLLINWLPTIPIEIWKFLRIWGY